MVETRTDFLLSSDVARLLDVTSGRVRQLEERGKLKAFRVGTAGVRVYTRVSVERLLAERALRQGGKAREGERAGGSQR